MQYCRNPVEADRERVSPFPTHDGRSGPPKGLFGLLYWYALYVPHRFIFTGMIEELGRRAELFQRHAARQNGSADAPLPDLTPELLAKLVER